MNIEIFFFFSLQTVVYICSVENHQTTKKSFFFNYSYTKFVLNFQFEKSLIKYYYYFKKIIIKIIIQNNLLCAFPPPRNIHTIFGFGLDIRNGRVYGLLLKIKFRMPLGLD